MGQNGNLISKRRSIVIASHALALSGEAIYYIALLEIALGKERPRNDDDVSDKISL